MRRKVAKRLWRKSYETAVATDGMDMLDRTRLYRQMKRDHSRGSKPEPAPPPPPRRTWAEKSAEAIDRGIALQDERDKILRKHPHLRPSSTEALAKMPKGAKRVADRESAPEGAAAGGPR